MAFESVINKSFKVTHTNGSSKAAFLVIFFRFPDNIGGNLSGVHYVRDVADADSLISSLVI